MRSELRYGLGVLAFDAVFLPLLTGSGAGRFVPPTITSVLVTVAFGLVVNEVWFYASHRLLHTRALYFIHAQHHVARVTDPMTTLSFSLAEHVIGFVPSNPEKSELLGIDHREHAVGVSHDHSS